MQSVAGRRWKRHGENEKKKSLKRLQLNDEKAEKWFRKAKLYSTLVCTNIKVQLGILKNVWSEKQSNLTGKKADEPPNIAVNRGEKLVVGEGRGSKRPGVDHYTGPCHCLL